MSTTNLLGLKIILCHAPGNDVQHRSENDSLGIHQVSWAAENYAHESRRSLVKKQWLCTNHCQVSFSTGTWRKVNDYFVASQKQWWFHLNL